MSADPIVPVDPPPSYHNRRKTDNSFQTTLQYVLMATGAINVIYGQAEMLGEPTRHIVTVAAVFILIIVAIWMKKT